MRKLSSIFVLVVMGIFIGFSSCNKGNGSLITSEKEVSSFDGVSVSSSATVNYHKSNETRVVVTVDDNLFQYVKITVKNNILHVGTKNGTYSFTTFIVDVYSPRVTDISISGSGSFENVEKIIESKVETKISGSGKIKGWFECDNFSIKISGSGKMDGNVKCTDFSSQISGSGNVNLTGDASHSDIHISGSGHFNGKGFSTYNADIRVSGSGNIHIGVEDYLKAHISGSGKVYYRGTPKIDFSGSGSGRLISE